MRKLIAAINMTLDGYCDHTAITPNEEIHDHYTEMLYSAGALLYGRNVYHLMEYWREVLKNPTGEKSMDEFAAAIDQVPKIVFSHTLKTVDWPSARLAKQELKDEIQALKLQEGKDIFVGSPSLIVQSINLNLLDELQLCIHPVLLGKGLPLFKNINEMRGFKLTKTKNFESGAVILYYRMN